MNTRDPYIEDLARDAYISHKVEFLRSKMESTRTYNEICNTFPDELRHALVTVIEGHGCERLINTLDSCIKEMARREFYSTSTNTHAD